MLTHMSLFSGIGGIDLAAEWAGFTSVGQCEWADYQTKVLEKHWPTVPRWRDIRSVTAESFRERTGLGTVDLVSGGFPCQPFSCAGKQNGKDDDRFLWPEMCRVINELKPAWVVAENVENAVRMVLDDIIDSLDGIGYASQTFVVSAYCSSAWYDGKRTFIVATPNDRCAIVRRDTQLQPDAQNHAGRADNGRGTPFVDSGKRWPEQYRPVGVVDGVPYRVDRLRSTGNAVNPYQVYPILKAIVDIEAQSAGE